MSNLQKSATMEHIQEINTELTEGKLLLAAIAVITTESRLDKMPDEVLVQLSDLSKQMFDK